MLLAIQAQHSTKENWFWTLLTPMVIYGSIKTFFLNLVGFNIEMLYTETDKGDLGQKRLSSRAFLYNVQNARRLLL